MKNFGLAGFIKQYMHAFLGIVYPYYCAACGNALFHNERILCVKCLTGIPRTGFHADPDNEVAQIFWGRTAFRNATAFMYFTRESNYRNVLHELKYRGQQQVGWEMGRLFGLELKDTPFAQADLIHPVPLHPAKLKQRGYNQSELIAKGMSEVLHIPVESSLVIRRFETGTQTHKARFERWTNVKGTFCVTNTDQSQHKHILLIDDVITTGATVEACAEAFHAIPGVTLSIASLAYTKLQ